MKKYQKALAAIGTLVTAGLAGMHYANRIIAKKACEKELLFNQEGNYYSFRFGNIFYTKQGSGQPLLLIHELNPACSHIEFKAIIEDMFCLKGAGNGDDYNPEKGRAEKIAEKLRKGKTKVAKLKGLSTDKVAVFSNYISGLAVGLQLDINDIMNYTVYQLFDQYQRFIKKQNSDVYLQAKMAGATGLDEVDNWMDNIHS